MTKAFFTRYALVEAGAGVAYLDLGPKLQSLPCRACWLVSPKALRFQPPSCDEQLVRDRHIDAGSIPTLMQQIRRGIGCVRVKSSPVAIVLARQGVAFFKISRARTILELDPVSLLCSFSISGVTRSIGINEEPCSCPAD
jgi:hypothetical protein